MFAVCLVSARDCLITIHLYWWLDAQKKAGVFFLSVYPIPMIPKGCFYNWYFTFTIWPKIATFLNKNPGQGDLTLTNLVHAFLLINTTGLCSGVKKNCKKLILPRLLQRSKECRGHYSTIYHATSQWIIRSLLLTQYEETRAFEVQSYVNYR